MQRDWLAGLSIDQLAGIASGDCRKLLVHLQLTEPHLSNEFLLALLDRLGDVGPTHQPAGDGPRMLTFAPRSTNRGSASGPCNILIHKKPFAPG